MPITPSAEPAMARLDVIRSARRARALDEQSTCLIPEILTRHDQSDECPAMMSVVDAKFADLLLALSEKGPGNLNADDLERSAEVYYNDPVANSLEL
jgi:hypothetical protein